MEKEEEETQNLPGAFVSVQSVSRIRRNIKLYTVRDEILTSSKMETRPPRIDVGLWTSAAANVQLKVSSETVAN